MCVCYLNMCRSTCSYMHICEGSRFTPGISCMAFHLLNLELTVSASLLVRLLKRPHLHLLHACTTGRPRGLPSTLPGSWELNSAPQACTVSCISTGSSLQPSFYEFSLLKAMLLLRNLKAEDRRPQAHRKYQDVFNNSNSGVKEMRSSYFTCHRGSHSPVQRKVNWSDFHGAVSSRESQTAWLFLWWLIINTIQKIS